MNRAFKRVLVTGGAGYVGSALVPALLDAGYSVRVLYIYGRDLFAQHRGPQLSEVVGDLRDAKPSIALPRPSRTSAPRFTRAWCLSR